MLNNSRQLKVTRFINLVLAFALFAFTACVSINDITIGQIQNVKVGNVNGSDIDVSISLPVENPNSFPIKVKNADLAVLFTDNKVIGAIKQIDPITFPGKSKGVYPIKLKVELNSSASSLFSVFSFFSAKTPMVRLKGSLKIGSFLFSRKVQIDQAIPLKL